MQTAAQVQVIAADDQAWSPRRSALFILFGSAVLWAPVYLAVRILLG
ncbi:hypothetical protein P7B02_01945 [Caulobacter segnis]|nr:hypothetical protein [Caulobacter segnis]MDG2520287.1 hypothetical protein [Caulobacter segnis]